MWLGAVWRKLLSGQKNYALKNGGWREMLLLSIWLASRGG
jgi:hypothetical protein